MTRRSRVARILWVPTCEFVKFVVKWMGGFQVEGKGNVPRQGALLLCPNHFTDLDPPAVAAALPRYARFLAKSELFEMGCVGRAIRLFDAIPVKRNSADRAAVREVLKSLANGDAVVIFPEGGGNDDGMLQPLNPGAMMIALQSGAPVIPAAIHNAQRFLPYKSTRLRHSPVPLRIVFGEPVFLSDLPGRRDAVALATERLTLTLAQMLGQPVPVGKPAIRD